MKALMLGLAVLSCAVAAWGETFQMDRKGDSTVEVQKSSGEYRVTCTFSPQTKFDKAINAKMNDAKGDSLCKKGLMRYLKVATNETLTIAGQYAAAPVKTVGGKLCYSFGVPVSGCQVEKIVVRPKPQPKSTVQPVVASTNPVPVVSPVLEKSTNAVPAAAPKVEPVVEPAAPQQEVSNVVRTSSFLCVTEYREVNGERTEVSRREYQGRNFKSREEFDDFCQKEFARVRAIGEANLRAVRNFGK